VLISENVLNVFGKNLTLEQKIVLQYLTTHFLSNVNHYNNQTGLFNEIFSADSHVKM